MTALPLTPGLSPDERAMAARAGKLIAVAEDLAGEFSLRPLLERILRRCTELLGCDAGSICSVDEAAGTYRKEADIGVACQSGRVFPLTEGMTGAVVARRAPGLVHPLRRGARRARGRGGTRHTARRHRRAAGVARAHHRRVHGVQPGRAAGVRT